MVLYYHLVYTLALCIIVVFHCTLCKQNYLKMYLLVAPTVDPSEKRPDLNDLVGETVISRWTGDYYRGIYSTSRSHLLLVLAWNCRCRSIRNGLEDANSCPTFRQ